MLIFQLGLVLSGHSAAVIVSNAGLYWHDQSLVDSFDVFTIITYTLVTIIDKKFFLSHNIKEFVCMYITHTYIYTIQDTIYI
jgi:hypothetical protein